MSSPAPKIINLTPHAVVLNDGTVFPPSGTVARIAVTYLSKPAPLSGTTVTLYWSGIQDGGIIGLPAPVEGTYLVVSAMVGETARRRFRSDLLVPATGHPETKRDAHGQIISVPGFIVP